ncbi:MAG: hypothetical protein LBK47_06580 [Prevotellaceae bacterium]|jgi:hypothetical protein|nr:hypothetical protein [Prevotellaceae bacterium]
MGASIGISEALKVRLAAFKKTYGLPTYEHTLNVMLNYFAEVGDDPTNPQFTAKAQMVKMNKRLDQVVRFIRVFEKQKLQPVLDELVKQSRHMLEVMPSGATVAAKADVEELEELLQDLPTHKELTDVVMKIYDTLNLRQDGRKHA